MAHGSVAPWFENIAGRDGTPDIYSLRIQMLRKLMGSLGSPWL